MSVMLAKTHMVFMPPEAVLCVAAKAKLDPSAAEPAAAQSEVVVPDPLPEPYTSLFKQAREAPTEFNTWTSLISAAEKLVRLSLLAIAKAVWSLTGHAVIICSWSRCTIFGLSAAWCLLG